MPESTSGTKLSYHLRGSPPSPSPSPSPLLWPGQASLGRPRQPSSLSVPRPAVSGGGLVSYINRREPHQLERGWHRPSAALVSLSACSLFPRSVFNTRTDLRELFGCARRRAAALSLQDRPSLLLLLLMRRDTNGQILLMPMRSAQSFEVLLFEN